MSADPFDDLLELENVYYKEGYDAGVSDSSYAGMIEGKLFGIEKGYGKALELGKLQGRALVWQGRTRIEHTTNQQRILQATTSTESEMLSRVISRLPPMTTSARLQRHLEGLLSTADASTVRKDNSDDAVTEFDERLAKAKAKAKVITNLAGDRANTNAASNTNSGIEDATGLNARH
jgi:hypothetical protein